MTARGGGHRVSLRQRPRPAPLRGEILKALIRRAAARLSPPESDLRILVVGDEEMVRWNRDYLGRPGTTNVISFPEDQARVGGPTPLAGDILISAPTCLAQTRGWPGTAEERILYFVIHGMVHILGHDHDRGAAEAGRMRRLEREVYRRVLGAPENRSRLRSGVRPPAGLQARRIGRGARRAGSGRRG